MSRARGRIGGLSLVLALIALLSSVRTGQAFRAMGTWSEFDSTKPPIEIPPHYAPVGPQGHRFSHWDLRRFPDCDVPWTFCDTLANHPHMPGDSQVAAVQAAFDTWEAVEPAKLSFVKVAGPSPRPPFYRDRWNTIGFVPYVPYPLYGLTLTLADTRTGRLLEADIGLNQWEWFGWNLTEGDQGWCAGNNADLRTVALHEIGHFIGLCHTQKRGLDIDYLPIGDFPTGSDVDANGDGVFNTPIMVPFAPDIAIWHLDDDDRDGINFLYDPDHGDAPDPWVNTYNRYPTRVHKAPTGEKLNSLAVWEPGKGAEHLFGIKRRQPTRNYTYEWLGRPMLSTDDVDAECHEWLVDRDQFDDGVTFAPDPPLCGKVVWVTDWLRYATDADSNSHVYVATDSTPERPMWVSTWVDLNRDGVWSAGERAVHESYVPPTAPPREPSVTFAVVKSGTFTLPKPGNDERPFWVRSRIDWMEDSGHSQNVDRTLKDTEGTAQFGEVEDYPITCSNPSRQLVVRNTRGADAAGIAMVVPGNALVGTNYQSFVSPADCPSTTFQTPPAATYDGVRDETTIEYRDPGLVLTGQDVHVGRHQPDDSPTQVVRAYWIPTSGAAGILDQIPTTNAAVHAITDTQGNPLARVVVGVVDQASGGSLAGDPAIPFWQDSTHVDVLARILPAPLALSSLSLCNPALTSAPAVPLGSRWVKPDSPLRADLPGLSTGQTVVLEVHSVWSVNGSTSTELLQFDDPLQPTLAVGPAPKAPRPHLGLAALPNPSAGIAHLQFVLPAAARVDLALFDVRGRRVRTLMRGERLEAGPVTRLWDGRDDAGRRLPPGVYYVELRAGRLTSSLQMVLFE